jgi:hypothetical protein
MNLFEDKEGDNLPIDDNKNYLEELVGENKKFKTAEDLAKGKFASDHYVKILEARLDGAREEMSKMREQTVAGSRLQDLIDRIDSMKQDPSRETPKQSNEEKVPAFTPDDVDKRIQAYEQSKQEKNNFDSVMQKVKEVYGREYVSILKEQSEQLGLSDEEVNKMARSTPKLFMKTFELDKPQSETFQAPPRSDRRSDTFAPRAPQKRNWAYYEELRKQNPMAWMDKKIAYQMDRDAQEQGPSFYQR